MVDTGPLACLRKKVQNGSVSKDAFKRLKDDVEKLREEVGPGIGREHELLDLALFRAENNLKMRKIQTALQIKAIDRVNERVAQLAAKGAASDAQALISLLVRDIREQAEGLNVEAVWESTNRMAQGLFAEGLKTFRPKGMRIHPKLVSDADKAQLQLFVREVFGEQTGNELAARLANTWKTKVDPFLYKRFQRAGGNLIPRNNWNMPQYHDAGKIAVASKAEWSEYVISRLNRAEMLDRSTGLPLSDAQLVELVGDSYDSIVTNGLSRDKGPNTSKLANRHTAERVFVFRDADSFMEYDERFGSGGDIFSLMTGHMDRMSREIALLEVLGPNPDATFAHMQRLAGLDKASQVVEKTSRFGDVRDQTPAKQLDNIYTILTGRDEVPSNNFAANSAAATRNFLTAAQLGGAYLSALTDWGFMRMAAKYNGLSTAGVWGKALSQFVRGAFGEEGTEFAIRLGLGAESWANSALGAQRFVGDIVGPQNSRVLPEMVLRASLLTPWTQAARHSFGLEVMGVLGDSFKKGIGWEDLNPQFRSALERRGLNATEYNMLAKSDLEDREGLPFASFLNMAEIDPRATQKIQQFVVEEVEFSTPSNSTRARAFLKQGTQAGTVPGEAFRFVGMYKMFPMMLIQTHLARAWWGAQNTGAASRLGYLADFVITTTILGSIAMQAKQIAAGKDPIPTGLDDEDNPEAASKFILASMLQGGALGIMGDFLFADQNRFGKGIVSTMVGPAAALVDDVGKFTVGNIQELVRGEDTKFGREFVQMARKYTPGGNIWYTKTAFERVLLDRMQLWFDPDARRSFQQRESKLKQDFGSEFFWGPGELTPDRGPEL